MFRGGLRALSTVVLAAVLSFAASTAFATDPPPVVAVSGASISAIPQVSAEPKLQDFEGMEPHGNARELLEVSHFVQMEPTDGAPPTQRTRVFLGYDSTRLFIAWLCYDTNPSAIRAHMVRRENLYKDDFVEVTLDTFHDQRHAFVFATNPLGIQADGLWSESGNGPDNSWDTVWETHGTLTPQGYIVIQAIPFRSLRFNPADKQTWGLVLARSIARNSEWDFWPRISSRISGRLSQEGRAGGIEGISPGRNLQFIPYASLRSFRSLDQRDSLNPRFDSRRAETRFGLDSKFVIHDSLVLDTTVNPDFSQVESDEPQNTVNQRFEVFFPEKRPFFLENSNFFEDSGGIPGPYSTLVFTRRIADPEFGARLSGKVDKWNVGLLVADDRSPGKIVPDNDPLRDTRAYFAVGRVLYDIGKQSNFGFIYTDREYQGNFNRVGGPELHLKVSKNWNATARSVVSSTNEQGTYLYGSDTEATLSGDGRRFSSVFTYQDITPGFRTETGFAPRTDIRRVYTYDHFYFRPEGKHLIMWGPEGNAEYLWDHTGQSLGYNISTDLVFSFRRNILIAPIVGMTLDNLRPIDFPDLPANKRYSQTFGGLVFRANPVSWFSVNTRFFRQGAVNYVPLAGQAPQMADETFLTQGVTIQPVQQLQIDNTYILDRLRYNKLDHGIFTNHIIRSKWNYQFNRELSFRFIAQYNGLLVNPQYTTLQTTKSMNYDFLLTYLLHPGTAVYVGYNTNMQNIDPGLCTHIGGTTQCDPNGSGLLRTRNGFINDGRQFFVKVSYLFRR